MKIELTDDNIEKIQKSLNIAKWLALVKKPSVHGAILEGSVLFDDAVRQAPPAITPAKLRTTPESRKRMLGLDTRAMPGPWEASQYSEVLYDGHCVALTAHGETVEDEKEEAQAIAEFAAHSRTFAPDAARDVEMLLGLLQRCEARILPQDRALLEEVRTVLESQERS